jgi:hypothetical protein
LGGVGRAALFAGAAASLADLCGVPFAAVAALGAGFFADSLAIVFLGSSLQAAPKAAGKFLIKFRETVHYT